MAHHLISLRNEEAFLFAVNKGDIQNMIFFLNVFLLQIPPLLHHSYLINIDIKILSNHLQPSDLLRNGPHQGLLVFGHIQRIVVGHIQRIGKPYTSN